MPSRVMAFMIAHAIFTSVRWLVSAVACQGATSGVTADQRLVATDRGLPKTVGDRVTEVGRVYEPALPRLLAC
jgi:hypothetical protein